MGREVLVRLMKILIFSDLHSNSYALHQILLVNNDCDLIISLGDSVGLLPKVKETLNLHIENNIILIRGNHEEALLDHDINLNSTIANIAIMNQRKSIDRKALEYVESSKYFVEMEVDALKMLFIHKINRNDRLKYVFNYTKLETTFIRFDYVFFGHTHFETRFRGKFTNFINPGSAGFPILPNGKNSYCVIDTKNNKVDFFSFSYDKEALIMSINKSGYDKKLIQLISSGQLK